MKFRERAARFMAGRYGMDQLARALLWVYLALLIISLFLRPFLYVALALMIYLIWRMLSKNLGKRQAENQKYLRLSHRITGWFSLQRRKWKERKDYRYRRCPHCRATLRLPNRKGAHVVNCPKCHQDFNIKI